MFQRAKNLVAPNLGSLKDMIQLVFVDLYEEAIVPSLFELSECDRSISSRASGLLTAIEKSYFVVSLWTCEKLFT